LPLQRFAISAGGGGCVAASLFLASLRLATLRTIVVRSPAALLAWASGQALGRSANHASPVRVVCRRHRNSRARRRHRLPWRFRVESINRTTRLSRRTLHDRPDHYGVRGWRFRSSACVVILRSGASLEVLSPSALAGRVALFEAAGHRTIPLRRFARPPALWRTHDRDDALAVFRIAVAAAAMLA
jgi:hypothetical protein